MITFFDSERAAPPLVPGRAKRRKRISFAFYRRRSAAVWRLTNMGNMYVARPFWYLIYRLFQIKTNVRLISLFPIEVPVNRVATKHAFNRIYAVSVAFFLFWSFFLLRRP